VQEPDHGDELTIAYMSGLHDGKKKRAWVSLTADEIVNMLPDDDTPMSLGEAFFKFAELVEAKLKEKNT
jgi:hypothetical protein